MEEEAGMVVAGMEEEARMEVGMGLKSKGVG